MKNAIPYFAASITAIASSVVAYVCYMFLSKIPYTEGLNKMQEEIHKAPTVLTASLLQLTGNLVLASILAWLINKMVSQTTHEALKLATLVRNRNVHNAWRF